MPIGKRIEIVMDFDTGEISGDLINGDGKACVNELERILAAFGKTTDIKKKNEYWRPSRVLNGLKAKLLG